ncbi:MAG TPA: FtsX-like permease family protein, partial [Propionibacteriaceae bacterium]|nr:FtsX-like permease family protein [Propionibacteriaceae bacterium]
LPLDMQRVLSDPLGNQVRLTQQITPTRLQAGETAHVRLELANRNSRPANEVVIRDEPPEPLHYVPGSTVVDGTPIADLGGDSPLAQGEAKLGLNLGTVPARTTVTVAYEVQADAAVDSVSALGLGATFSSRESATPTPANASEPLSLAALTDRIARVPGVAHADQLSFVDLAPGALRSSTRESPDSVRVFGFDEIYRGRDPSIRIVDGSYQPGHGLLSAEAARALGVRPGGVVQLRVPGRATPLDVPISGITDLTQAKSLFYSRQGQQLEQFIYVRNSVVVGPEVFAGSIVTAFQNATTGGERTIRSQPILEVDIAADRMPLDADPGAALAQTTAVARAVNEIAPGQDVLIDNISNALMVARDDALVAKRMFVFLGLPGAVLAAILTSYAGGVLAGALRREQAILRIRGADRRGLLRMHAVRSLVLAACGSLLGVGLGLISAVTVLSADDLARASKASLLGSAAISAGTGFLATGVALYAAGLGAIRRQISEERAQLATRRPLWQRLWLDVVILVPLAVYVVHARRTGAFEGVGGSVYYGRSVSLRLQLVVIPLGVWLGSILLYARVVGLLLGHVPRPRRLRFGRPVVGLLTRSVRRRAWAAVSAVIMVGLVVALGTSIASFSASYDQAKAADTRFVVGSDIRVTPGPTSTVDHPPGFARTLAVPGVQAVTPVVFGLSNALVESEVNEDAANMAAIDPAEFGRIAPLTNATFVGRSAANAMSALRRRPKGVFVGTELADMLEVEKGDEVKVLFARGTKQQKLTSMKVLGLFERLPGFPEGANVLVNLERQVELVPSTNVTFFLARTTDTSAGTLHRAVAALREGPGSADALQIDSRETALDKDQSSLAALNIRGLLTLDSAYALAMAATAITVYVFGLLLQRRREYVTLRAQGLRASLIRSLLVTEAGGVAVLGAAAGVLAGIAMAYFLVRVLRPLFVLRPSVVIPAHDITILTALVLAVSMLASLAATSLVNRLPTTELLRDE